MSLLHGVIQYPHPTLRHVSKPLKRVDDELRVMIREMFDLMYQHKGIGLAANQVDLPYRVFVVNVTGDPHEPAQEQVYINPVLSGRKGIDEKEEGCLSLPGLYGDVKRPTEVEVRAYNLQGQEIHERLTGLPARVVQHETDHLDGILFIDRLSQTGAMEAREAIEQFEIEFDQQCRAGAWPSEAEMAARLSELERLRT